MKTPAVQKETAGEGQGSGTGQIKAGTVYGPVKIEASSKPVITIGKAGQPAASLAITETAAGVLVEDEDILLELPEGFTWSRYPDVRVTKGDLEIYRGGITTRDSDRILVIPVEDKSTVPATIELNNLKITVDRTVPAGDVYVKVKGGAVNRVNNRDELDDVYAIDGEGYVLIDGKRAFKLDEGAVFPETGTAAAACLATVKTVTDPGLNITAEFKIGSAICNINGEDRVMEVAPYVSQGRVYIPVKYAAMAAGVDGAGYFWDGNTAALIRGGQVLQVKQGSKDMLLNGIRIVMDAAPEVKKGHLMVPLRWVARVFGVELKWDGMKNTAEIKLQAENL